MRRPRSPRSSWGARVFVSGGYIGQFEQAIRKPQLDVAQRIDTVLQTAGFFERMWRKLIDDKRYADYFAEAVELERMAAVIEEFEPAVVPGLLQTAPYAWALTAATHPLAPDEFIDEKVSARMERADILKDAARPRYWVIMHECVLRTPVGGTATMLEQLVHVTALARERKVVAQVLPFEAGAHAAMGKSLRLMEFDDAPPTAYTEAAYSGDLLDDPAVVKRARHAYDLLRAAALSPKASLALITSAAEDYRRCTSTT